MNRRLARTGNTARRTWRARGRLWLSVLALAFSLLPHAAPATESTNAPRATVRVSGYGWLGNRDLKQMLGFVLPRKGAPTLGADFVEDAALVLLATVARDGYLRPKMTTVLVLADGTRASYSWDNTLETRLPRPMAARRVHFKIEPGVRSHYADLQFSGLRSLSDREARALFIETGFLLQLRSTRVFTPRRLDRSIERLIDELARRGFADAVVTARHVEIDDHTGAVRVEIDVNEGLPTIVRSARTEVYAPGDTTPRTSTVTEPRESYSQAWFQSFSLGLRTNQYERGFPDASVAVETIARETNAATVELDLLARVQTGPLVRLGGVRFEGAKRTEPAVLDRRVQLDPGGPLDRLEIERARTRLARLGAFRSVGVRYEAAPDPELRDVIYELKEADALSINLLAGYGSYELLRGGVELEQNNLFGWAHQARLRAAQSFKSTSADFLYNIPEVFRENFTVFANASGLRREEITFTREEYGGGLGVRQFLPESAVDLSLRYSLQILNALDTGLAAPAGTERTRAGAFILDFRHDRRDNPLLPHTGYKLLANIETASGALGGEVDYQRAEISGSIHFDLGGGRFLHAGVSHGITLELGGRTGQLPFVKRFFPGGENSVRGYQQGEASPRDALGEIVGAETYLQGNLEFEQFLTPSWSVVVFADGVGFAEDRRDYPLNESLYSVGAGIRWKTIIGPARLEYGHNLNPRPGDPGGTLHFSIGFPF